MLKFQMLSALMLAAATAPAMAAAPDFDRQIVPVFKNRCVPCHGPNKQEGELNLSLPPTIARGGESGRVIVPGDSAASRLWERLEADEMPPENPLPREEKQLLKQWIEAGAPGLPRDPPPKPEGDEHWAFQRLTKIAPPEVKNLSLARTPIDRFILARLESAGLSLAPEADRATLIRRVALDLTGLPPSPEEIRQFLDDASDGAYERMVERYLASPRYGERWGKYWLDAAGYADSNGYFFADTDRPLAYRYRDYVIRSLNADKPWDEFIREQLAGDELAGYGPKSEVTPQLIELLVATHYLRNSPDGTDSSDGNPDEVRADKYAVLEGTLQIVGSSLLGITVQCAKCHDHKFEPLKQRDYYQLQSVIYPALNVERWVPPNQRQVVAASPAELTAWQAQSRDIDRQIAERRAEFASWLRENRQRGRELFSADFNADRPLAAQWSNAAPGDEAPAGQPAVNIDSPKAPGAQSRDGVLRLVESRDDGDRAFCTQNAFDWTPDQPGGWIQATFDLPSGHDGPEYLGYFIALRDFNDAGNQAGGNILIDGSAKAGATVYVDYPGADSHERGAIGKSGYKPGHNFGVRVTNAGDGRFELAQIVDGIVEPPSLVLSAGDLPQGGFGFEYCCGRSFVVDNVRIEEGAPEPDAASRRAAIEDAIQKKRKQCDADVKKLEEKRGDRPGSLAAVTDMDPKPADAFLLPRGDYKSRKDRVGPAAPAVLSEPANPGDLAARCQSTAASSGRRLAFARWLTQPDSRAAALLARVTANRWWQHHFGTGIVATPENLGYSGAAPTHRELLDYLAGELVAGGWSAKQFHRLVLNSAVYRQSSAPRQLPAGVEADDRLLWRFPVRRLDAEAIRDSMLAASGELDLREGGPYVPTKRSGDGDIVVDDSTDGAHRRSVYIQQRRTQVLGLLDAFDAPSITVNCTFRAQTTVPLQSLKLLNSEFVRGRAKSLAARLAAEAGSDAETRVRRAYLLAVGREPSPDELAASLEFVREQSAAYQKREHADDAAWCDFCQAVLASNAFLYVQ